MTSRQSAILVLGLAPACWAMWLFGRAHIAGVPWTVQRAVLFCWLMLPAVVACAIALSPRRVVRWCFARLARLVIAFLGASCVLIPIGLFLEPGEFGSNFTTVMALGFGVAGAIVLLVSVFGRRAMVEKIVDSL